MQSPERPNISKISVFKQSAMDVAKVAKDYFLSSQSSLLIPNSEYGSRKLVNIGLSQFLGSGGVNLLTVSTAPTPSSANIGEESAPKSASLGAIRDLLVGGSGRQRQSQTLRQKSQAMRSGKRVYFTELINYRNDCLFHSLHIRIFMLFLETIY